VFLDQGQIAVKGSLSDALALYARSRSPESCFRNLSAEVTIVFKDSDGQSLSTWNPSETLVVEVILSPKRPLARPAVDLAFYNESSVKILSIQSDRTGAISPQSCTGDLMFTFTIQPIPLACPEVTVDVGIRADGDPDYCLLERAARTIPIATDERQRTSSVGSLLIVACAVRVSEVPVNGSPG
jgi:hypothetical protein